MNSVAMNTIETTPLKVVFVEDSEVDVELTVIELERDNFDVSWDRVETESDLRAVLQSSMPEIVISDYSMPNFDGITSLRVVQEIDPYLPFIFLSGTIGEERAIESIREGATDYVLKNNMRRLCTAVRRALSDTEERARARAAEEARNRLAAILEATSDCVAMCNPDGGLIYLNGAGQVLTGITEKKMCGMNISSLHPDNSKNLIMAEGWRSAIRTGLWHGETKLLTVDGDEVPMSQVIIAHRDSNGDVEYVSTIARDIRERKAYEDRIVYLANYDALTELPNRSLLQDRTVQAMSYGRHSDRTLALLVINIDRFKLVNDGYGQSTGDKLLKLMGERLLSSVREGDTVARLGADSFAILATDLAHPDDTLTVVRKIQSITRKPFVLDAREVRLTVSIGASIHPRDGSDFETMLRNADAAMHQVKLNGEDSFRFYDVNMTSDAADRVDLESDLRAALDRDEIHLHYQPQVLLSSRRIVGVEALMRWSHPQRGSVPPDVFIPIAEHSDFIHTLSDWAVTKACRQLKQWNDKGFALRMSVNISARRFRSSEFPGVLKHTIGKTGVRAADLELELTESVLVDDQVETKRTMDDLKKLGVKVAVDDFGTGYSSLSYLSRLPIDCLKIDRTFLQRIPGERQDTAIVQAIISLAASLELDVIAEGIESEQQLEFLRDHRCAEGQGYFFSKPVPPSEVEILLQKQ